MWALHAPRAPPPTPTPLACLLILTVPLPLQACDIKDPSQNIRWTVPEGGGGPSYTLM